MTLTRNKEKISDLQKELTEKKQLVKQKQELLSKYKVYSDFLEEVINDDPDNKEFDDIDALKNRFFNLIKENKKLIEKSREINNQIEMQKKKEKDVMTNLQNQLYKMQRTMQQHQKDLEAISNQNSKLEQEFENEITKKNNANKQYGQVINAVNNIYDICIQEMHKKGRGQLKVMDLHKKLETIGETIEDLKEVAKLVPDFTREKFYTEEAAGTVEIKKQT